MPDPKKLHSVAQFDILQPTKAISISVEYRGRACSAAGAENIKLDDLGAIDSNDGVNWSGCLKIISGGGIRK